MNTDTPFLSIFYCKRAIPPYIFIFHSFKRCFSPHTIVFPLYETLALPIPLFLHSMKHSRFISLYFLLSKVPFRHTSFFILVNAVPSTHFLFPLYETLALHTSPFFISYRAGSPHLFFFSLIYAGFPYLFILTPIYAVRLYIDFPL